MQKEYDAELRDWSLLESSDGIFAVGRVYLDRLSRWPDGQVIRTSALQTGPGSEGDVITTRDTRFLLSGPSMKLSDLHAFASENPTHARGGDTGEEERLLDLLQAAWGMDDPAFELIAGFPSGWLEQWRNHNRSLTGDDIARVRRLASFHDALRLVAYGGPNYPEWWRRTWSEDSIIGSRSPLEAVLQDSSALTRLKDYVWAQM